MATRRGKRRRIARCIYRDRSGVAIVLKGKEHRYPPTMTNAELVDERNRLERTLTHAIPPRAFRGTLTADAERFLKLIRAGPSRATRRSELAGWIARFGQRHRFTIKPAEIREQLTEWLDDGVSPSTVNKRLSALRSLYRDLNNDPLEPNPARLVKKVDEEIGEPRDVPIDQIHRIIDAMPDRGRPQDGDRPHVSLTKLRLRVTAWTGFAPATMGRIRREDLRLHEDPPRVFVRPRRKGKGVKGTWLDLLPQAADALQALVDAGGLGPFNAQAMNHVWQRRCVALRQQEAEEGVLDAERIPAHITPYQIRHSFLTMFAAICVDERAVQEYAQHADIRTTWRYTRRSVPARVVAGIARLREALAGGTRRFTLLETTRKPNSQRSLG